ncbi:MAG: peptidoglycan DD-metalloendopeptidase family protein [Porticoccaceae bacterium]|nr:peptidoglycan DD-metalloendopeptidase family protein [Porticoccaceae bacterium]
MSKFLLAIAIFVTSSGVQSQSEAELEDLRRELEELQTDLNSYRGQVDQVEQQLQEQELMLAQNHREIFNTERSIAASEDLLSGLVDKVERLQQQREEQESGLREEIAAIYRSSGQEPLKLILNQEDPALFGRMLYYYEQLATNRQAKIDEYKETAEELEQAEISRTQELRHQQGLLNYLSSARVSLQNHLDERESLLNQLEQSIANTQEEIAANQANRERLETLVRNIAVTMAEVAIEPEQIAFTEIRGQCTWPAQGDLLASFGSVRTGSIRWDGVMIESDMGSPVRSVHNGRVVFSDYLRGYGLLVIIDHNDDYLTLYGHNQSLFVEAGDWVQPRQMIAQVGNSGGQRDPGLYFEIRKDGEPTNPASWCS